MSCLVLPSIAFWKAPDRAPRGPVVAASAAPADAPEPRAPHPVPAVFGPVGTTTPTPRPVSTPTHRPHPLAASRDRQARTGSYPINVAIADCESGDRLKNGRARHYSYDIRQQNGSSSASGKYQFIRSTWHSVTGLSGNARDYPESVQDAAFFKLWANGAGAFHWNASRSCWA